MPVLREQFTVIKARKRFVSQVELVSLHEFSQQRLPLIESLGCSWPLLEDVLFCFFGVNVGFVQTQLQVLLKLHSVGTAHGRLDRSERVAFDADTGQLWQ